MKAFAQLFLSLDETNKTNEKVRILKDYFLSVPDTDKMHMLALFTGRKPKRQINSTFIRNWAMEASHIPEWLFAESYQVVVECRDEIDQENIYARMRVPCGICRIPRRFCAI